MAAFFPGRHDQKNRGGGRLDGLCYSCCLTTKNNDKVREKLIREIKAKACKLKNIHKYLSVFTFLYEQNGLRLTSHEIFDLVYHNYDSFLEREGYLSDFLRNFSAIIESVGNSKIIRSEFRDFYMT
mgnify:CR=1 FL=1